MEQLKLFNIKANKIKRKEYISRFIDDLIFEDFLDILLSWDSELMCKNETKEDLVKSLKENFNYLDLQNNDGYEIDFFEK